MSASHYECLRCGELCDVAKSEHLTATGWRKVWDIKVGRLSLALTRRAPEFDLILCHLEGQNQTPAAPSS